jgi:hypothetical protein
VPAHDRTSSPAVEKYLSSLESALGELPANERHEIALETRSHIAERLQRNPDLSVEAIVTELGDPREYARGFLHGDTNTAEAGTITRVAAIATGGLRSLPLLMIVAFAYGIATVLMLLAFAKLLEPNATGLYISTAGGHRNVDFVISNPNHPGHEVLGYWLVVIPLLITAIIHFLVSRLLRRFVRKPRVQS